MPKEPSSDDKYMVNSLNKGLLLLELFNNNNTSEMSLSEISEKLNINKSSAYRLLYTLSKMGYINRDTNKNYTLDIKVIDLAHAYLKSISYKHEAYKVMVELRDSTGIAIHLFVLDNIEVVNLHNVQPLSIFSSNILPGLRWPAYATVIGQILLSSLSNEAIQERYKNFNQWKSYSDATPTSLHELLKVIDKARKNNYLVSWRNFNTDMVAGAAPVKDIYANEHIYALSVSCPAYLFSIEEFNKIIMPKVVDAADKLSKIYKPEYNW